MRGSVCFLLLALCSPAVAEPIEYTRQVKPLLAARCYSCHGALKQKSGLRLDTVAAMNQGCDGGAVVVEGKADAGSLLERLSSADHDVRMPPEGEGVPFEPAELVLIRRWIEEGARGPADELPEPNPLSHWAYQTPRRSPPPVATGHPIDAYLEAAAREQGLVPLPAADRRTLLRRVYFDLVGLPPSEAEIEAFLADESPRAYEAVVDRLLTSPAYGQRWGRHWMDVWRYSDWWGLDAEVRNSHKHLWHWRDWIVESLNGDVGYDEMVRQMLAADELYPNDLDKLRATGYLARQYFKFNRNSWLDETVEHTGKAFLGMTLNCARCHDHKYDPISQKDYYRFRAFFEPYQVRTDQLPGETDSEKNGIPRAFDCNLDAPTYLFVRGDEKNPDMTEALAPGVPGVLSLGELRIHAVQLPVEAYRPELRAWVLQNHFRDAEQKLAAAESKLQLAQATAARLAQRPPAPGPSRPTPPEAAAAVVAAEPAPLSIVRDDFARENPAMWSVLSGEWAWIDGHLEQRATGDGNRTLQLSADVPTDFQARLRFVTTGGNQWKSVGLCFDLEGNHDVLVYISAVAGHSKLQVAYKHNGSYVFPAEAAQSRMVKLGDAQDLVVKVRDRLLNIEVNGQLALAYRLPIPRQKGKLALVTFDARATFHELEVSPLPLEVKLAEGSPAAAPVTAVEVEPDSLEQAEALAALAEAEWAMAGAAVDALRARVAAERARWEATQSASAGDSAAQEAAAENLAAAAKEAARAAVKAERQPAYHQARLNLAQFEFQRLRSAPSQAAEMDAKASALRQAVDAAEQHAAQPAENYTPFALAGAKKTPESNVEPAESLARPFPAISSGRRSALAQWITDPRHPTAARVAVNHLWMRHLGTPLVPSVFDFGRNGSPPIHGQLLDYLAVEFVQHDWSMKHLHRLIVTSQAYQRSSSTRGAEANLRRDPENRYYWRANAVRLESQVARDALLHLAGELDLTAGGPPVPLAQTDASKRRSIYFVHSHNEHALWLSMFDDANVLDCYRRDQSIVPQQALTLANSKLALESAAKVDRGIAAERDADIPAEPGAADAAFIRRAYRLLLAADPSNDELDACREAMAEWRAQKLALDRIQANLVWALINHNDFITVR